MAKPDLTVIILTFNEEIHIKRAIESVAEIASAIWIVDSYSTDNTISIAETSGARTLKNVFTNQAAQFQWALDHCEIKTTWVMRLDADEYLTSALINELKTELPTIKKDVSGIVLKRQVHFMGKWIRHGGYYPVKLLRIWRPGNAYVEQRWMDEHTVLTEGKSITLKNDFIDDNLNSLSWWTAKHNDYATREAIEILNNVHQFIKTDQFVERPDLTRQAEVKRWYKNNLYLKMPMFIRCFLYFIFRFWIKLGFLDGQKGLVWHFLQGFWYRFLVDAKILQIEWWAKQQNKPVRDIIVEKYDIQLKSIQL